MKLRNQLLCNTLMIHMGNTKAMYVLTDFLPRLTSRLASGEVYRTFQNFHCALGAFASHHSV